MSGPDIDISSLTPEEEEFFLRAVQREATKSFPFGSLEELVASPDGFGLDKDGTMSNLQRGLCRILGGAPLGDLADDPKLHNALSLKEGALAKYRNKPMPQAAEIVVLAGVRTAKSLMAAAAAIWASQTIEWPSWLKPGEIPRYSIVSLKLDNAKVILSHLAAALSQPALSALRVERKSEALVAETGQETVGSFFLYTRNGKIVEICIAAGKRAGGSLVSRWFFGGTFDEAPRMVGSSEAVINYDDSQRALKSRLLKGSYILSIGSPWQPYGPIYDLVESYSGTEPNEDILIFRATGPDMNPVWWTPERCKSLKNSKNRNDKMAYQTDVLAKFADEEESLFSDALLAKCTRDSPTVLEWEPRRDYVAAMDPATRGNAWTLVIGSRYGRQLKEVFHYEWRGQPNEPLSPRYVLREIGEILRDYRLDWCYTDQWAADHSKDMALEEGYALVEANWTDREKNKAYTNLAGAMADGLIEISNGSQLKKDLKMVKKKPTSRGFSIQLPSTADGRHCDYAPAIARVFAQWIEDLRPEKEDSRKPEVVERRMLEQEEMNFETRKSGIDWMDESDFGSPDPMEVWERERNLLMLAKRMT